MLAPWTCLEAPLRHWVAGDGSDFFHHEDQGLADLVFRQTIECRLCVGGAAGVVTVFSHHEATVEFDVCAEADHRSGSVGIDGVLPGLCAGVAEAREEQGAHDAQAPVRVGEVRDRVARADRVEDALDFFPGRSGLGGMSALGVDVSFAHEGVEPSGGGLVTELEGLFGECVCGWPSGALTGPAFAKPSSATAPYSPMSPLLARLSSKNLAHRARLN